MPCLPVYDWLNVDVFQRTGVDVALNEVASHIGKHLGRTGGFHALSDAIERDYAKATDRSHDRLTGFAVG